MTDNTNNPAAKSVTIDYSCAGAKPETELPADKTVTIEVYDSFDKFEPMHMEWDKFVESINCEIFLTFDWCRLWWKYYGDNRQLQVFIFRNSGTPVAIIPMFFEKIWLGPVFIHTGKIVGTDFTISTVTPPIQKEFLQEVIQAFLAKLVTDYHWDILHIGPISGIYHDFGELFNLCKEHTPLDYRIRKTCNNVQTYFILADSQGNQIDLLSKKRRKIIKQKYNALHEAIGRDNTPVVARFALMADFQNVFDEFVKMHQDYWQKLNYAGHFGDWPNSRQFHLDVAGAQLKHNRLRLLEVNAGPYILGYKYAYKFGDKYLEFLDARLQSKEFERAGLGNIVFFEQLQKAQQEQVRYIDSLQGKYEHKLQMGGELFPINSIYIYSTGYLSLARTAIFSILSWLLNMCYYRIWFSRIAPKLPFKRRRLWQTWIRTNMFA